MMIQVAMENHQITGSQVVAGAVEKTQHNDKKLMSKLVYISEWSNSFLYYRT